MESLPARLQRIIPIRGTDQPRVLSRARQIRAAGNVPLIGDERWSQASWKSVRERVARWNRRGRVHQAAAWATFTSGTTTRPRVIVRSARSWALGAQALDQILNVQTHDVLLMPVHPVSSMASFSAAWADHSKLLLRAPDRARIQVGDLRGATLLHGTPWHLRDTLDLLDDMPAADRARSQLRAALIGGDTLDATLRQRAEAAGLDVIEYYGASELSFVGYDPDGAGLRAFPGVEVSTAAGMLWVKSEQTCLQVFGSGSSYLMADDGWSTVADNAELVPATTPQGESFQAIRLLGRQDQAILTAGATVVPRDVEIVLNRLPTVLTSLVLGAPDDRLGQRVTAYVLPRDVSEAASLDIATLVRQTAAELPPAARPRSWRVVAELPRTGAGKVRRLSYFEAEKLPRIQER